jgi:uncharacterized protein YbjT (DUF2867 family)
MARILVTGGTGTLGRVVVPALQAAGHEVAVLSRKAAGAAGPTSAATGSTGAPTSASGAERRTGDLRTGAGLAEALQGVSAVVHLASDPRHTREVDVDGTARLSGAAAAAGCGHLVVISIVGCDRVPFGYYRAKATAEEVALRGPVPASVLRATQFHELVVRLAQAATLGPVAVVPRGLRAASVDVRDVAERLVRAVADGPAGRLPDLGGPEDLGLADVAAAWARARGRRPPRPLHVPAWGGFLRAFAAGANLPGPDAERGTRTLAAWIAERQPAARR